MRGMQNIRRSAIAVSRGRMHTGYRSHGARHAPEYAPWANANIIVCVSIESLEGLENVEAIAAVEGIDMIAYGHSDLSAPRRSSPA
jgi:2-keto-3-deoxy-L-rhamnonate aldolase RhmA